VCWQNSIALLDCFNSPERIRFSAPEVVRYLRNNTVASLGRAQVEAETLGHHDRELTKRKHYQAKVPKDLQHASVYDYLAFFTHKLIKFLLNQASEVAANAIATIKEANKCVPQFLLIDFFKMIIDGWCLQTRFGHKLATCGLCRNGPDSMRHLPECEEVWAIFNLVFRDGSSMDLG
jgi:hypothetical protein